MTALSEKDRRAILGDQYKAIEEAALRAGGVLDADRVKNAIKAKAEANKFNALAIGTVGFILLISNYMAVSGPTLLGVTIFAAGLCVAGVAWYARQMMALRQISG